MAGKPGAIHVNRNPLHSIHRLRSERKRLVMSLANGFDFAGIDGVARHWLRKRMLVNHIGMPTDKGKRWACALLAHEAERIIAGELCADFGEE